MDMTFSSWSDYQVQILFSSWDVMTRWEYILSWWAVAFLALVYHGIRFMILMIEDSMYLAHETEPSQRIPLLSGSGSNIGNSNSSNHTSSGNNNTSSSSSYQQSLIEKDVENGNCCEDSLDITERNKGHSDYGILSESRWKKHFVLRSFHALLSALNYGLALLLMLVAMTYNSGLFLALLFGYGVGDFLFFTRTKYSVHECH